MRHSDMKENADFQHFPSLFYEMKNEKNRRLL